MHARSDLLLCAFVLLVACEGDPPLVSAPAVPMAATAAAQPASESPRAEGVTLISNGDEPRRALRWAPAAGTRQTVRLTVSSKSEMRAGAQGTPAAVSVPPIQADVQVVVGPAPASGGLQGEAVLGLARVPGDAKGNPELVGLIESTLSNLGGSRGRWARDPRGLGPPLALEAPVMATAPARELLASLNDALAALALELPEEAVGPGARWRSLQGGTRRTAILLRFDGDRAVLEVELETGGQVTTLPGMGMRRTARQAGKGLLTLDLARPLPAAAELSLEQQAEVELPDRAGPPARFATTTEITLVTP